MKILIWAPFGAGNHYWGPGTSAYRLYKKNDSSTIEVTLIHAADEQELFPDVFKEQIKLPSFRNGSYLDMMRYFWAARKWIQKNYYKYDVVHGITAFEYTFRPMLQFASYGIPVFVKLTGESGGFGDNSRISKILGVAKRRKQNANKISGYISISSHVTSNLLNNGVSSNKIFEITNGVDTNRFLPLTIEEKNNLRLALGVRKMLTFIYVGGLTYNKRVIEIVEAIAKIKSEGFVDFQFLIVGPDRSNGLVEKELEVLIKEKELEDTVIRICHTETPEKYLQVADVFLLVSATEGMSNALLEAMSCGLGAIVTPISGSVDLIENNKNGVFCDGTVEDITCKIKLFIENKDLIPLFGNRSREKILMSFSDIVIFKSHLELFNKYGANKKE